MAKSARADTVPARAAVRCPGGRSRRLDAVVWLAVGATVAAEFLAVRSSFAAGLVTFPAGIALSAMVFTDVRRRLVPARWVDVGAATTVTVLTAHGLVERTPTYLLAAVATAAGTWLVWWLLRVVSGNGIGYGDVRLATMAALPLGALAWPAALVFTPAVFLVAAALLVPMRSAAGEVRIPMVPGITVAWAGAVLVTVLLRVPFNQSASFG